MEKYLSIMSFILGLTAITLVGFIEFMTGLKTNKKRIMK